MTENRPGAQTPGQLDAISLEQALVDFEIANNRVVDLTGRLTEMSQELIRVRSELSETTLRLRQAEVEKDGLRNQLAEITSSLAYRVSRGLGDGRARLIRR